MAQLSSHVLSCIISTSLLFITILFVFLLFLWCNWWLNVPSVWTELFLGFDFVSDGRLFWKWRHDAQRLHRRMYFPFWIKLVKTNPMSMQSPLLNSNGFPSHLSSWPSWLWLSKKCFQAAAVELHARPEIRDTWSSWLLSALILQKSSNECY